MPTVPIYDEPQVREAPVSGAKLDARPSLEDFGGGDSLTAVNAATDRVAEAGSRIYDVHKIMADQMYAASAHAQITNIKNNAIYNPDDGLMTYKGQNAFQAPEAVAQKYKEQTDALYDSATNDSQKKALSVLIDRSRSELNAEVQKHVYSEGIKFDKDSTDANIQAAINNGVDNYQSAGQVATSADAIKNNIDYWGQRNGLSQAQIENQKSDALSQLHAGVIQRMVNNGEDLLARNYFDYHKDQMDAKTVEASEKLVETGSVLGDAQRNSDTILNQTSSMSQALAQARDIQDPRVRKATTEQIQERFNQKETARRQSDEDNSRNGAAIIQANGGNYYAIPVSQRANLSAAVDSSLRNYATTVQKGVQPATDWQRYYDLKTMASTPATHDDFLELNLMGERGHMADSQFQELLNLQAGARKGDANTQKDIATFRSNKQVADEGLKVLGVNPKSNPQAASQYYQAVDQAQAEQQAKTGKKLSSGEMQDVVDSLTKRVITDPSAWFGGTKYGYQLKPGEGFQVNTSDIPDKDLNQIKAAYKARGVVPSDQQLANAYQQRLQQLQGRGRGQ